MQKENVSTGLVFFLLDNIKDNLPIESQRLHDDALSINLLTRKSMEELTGIIDTYYISKGFPAPNDYHSTVPNVKLRFYRHKSGGKSHVLLSKLPEEYKYNISIVDSETEDQMDLREATKFRAEFDSRRN